jgi:ribulose kinase
VQLVNDFVFDICFSQRGRTFQLAMVPFDIEQRLSLICGTSTSHMVLSKTAHYVPGIWGPYYGAVLPEMYLNEAGQTATGSILKLVLDMKPETSIAITSLLDRFDNETDLLEVPNLVRDVHVWPDYHGNRSPLADSTMKGAIVGLTLDFLSDEFQPTLYLAHVFALAYGTRFIVETLQQNDHKPINMVFACGGLAKNLLYIQAHAQLRRISGTRGCAARCSCRQRVPNVERSNGRAGAAGQYSLPTSGTWPVPRAKILPVSTIGRFHGKMQMNCSWS